MPVRAARRAKPADLARYERRARSGVPGPSRRESVGCRARRPIARDDGCGPFGGQARRRGAQPQFEPAAAQKQKGTFVCANVPVEQSASQPWPERFDLKRGGTRYRYALVGDPADRRTHEAAPEGCGASVRAAGRQVTARNDQVGHSTQNLLHRSGLVQGVVVPLNKRRTRLLSAGAGSLNKPKRVLAKSCDSGSAWLCRKAMIPWD